MLFERPREVGLVAPYKRTVGIIGDDTLKFFVFEVLPMGVENVEEAFLGTFTASEYFQMIGDNGECEYLRHLCRTVLHNLICVCCYLCRIVPHNLWKLPADEFV